MGLTTQEYIEKSKKYETPYGDVYILHNAKSLGLAISGGFDSAVLLYLLAKTINDTGSNAEIYPFGARKTNPTEYRDYDRVDVYPYVDKVLEFVKSQFPNVKIHNQYRKDADFTWLSYYKNNRYLGSYTEVLNLLTRYMSWYHSGPEAVKKFSPNYGDILYVDYGGVTKNPKELPLSGEDYRADPSPNYISEGAATVVYTDSENPYMVYFEPFRNADKRVTFYLAEQHNIRKKLLEITRSCEGDVFNTENFTKTCNICWWCLERDWAHKNFKRTELE
jgi:hypothetical protein